MIRPTDPVHKTGNWLAHGEALKRRGALTVRFDPEMIRAVMPACRRGLPMRNADGGFQRARFLVLGGARGARTPDLLHAIQEFLLFRAVYGR